MSIDNYLDLQIQERQNSDLLDQRQYTSNSEQLVQDRYASNAELLIKERYITTQLRNLLSFVLHSLRSDLDCPRYLFHVA